MATERSPILPTELIDRICQIFLGEDLFNFTLALYDYLHISNGEITRLLRAQSGILLTTKINSLLAVSNSPYISTENGITALWSSCKWINNVRGPFTLSAMEKSLKYFSTTVFFLYARLWSFNPFYYEACYPTLEIFKYPYLLQQRSLSDDERALFTVWQTNSVAPYFVTNFKQFLHNYSSRYEYDIWGTDIDWNLFVIAGGSVISSLLVNTSADQASDVDLFFIEGDANLFYRAVDELEARLQRKYYIRRKTIWPKRLVQFDLFRNFNIQHLFGTTILTPAIIIQLIRPKSTRTNISAILHSFDLDICAAAFNSMQVIISFGCLQALNTGYTTCHANLHSPAEFMKRATRLSKYKRRGFNILCPKGFNIDTFLATDIEHCKETRQQRTYRFQTGQFGSNCDCFGMQKQFCEYFKLN